MNVIGAGKRPVVVLRKISRENGETEEHYMDNSDSSYSDSCTEVKSYKTVSNNNYKRVYISSDRTQEYKEFFNGGKTILEKSKIPLLDYCKKDNSIRKMIEEDAKGKKNRC